MPVYSCECKAYIDQALTSLAKSMNHSLFAGGAAVVSAFRIPKVVSGRDLLGVYVFLSYVYLFVFVYFGIFILLTT